MPAVLLMHDALFWRLPSLLTGFPESEFPGFQRYYEDAKTSRTSQRRSRLSRPALPALDDLFARLLLSSRRCAWMLLPRFTHPVSFRRPRSGSPVFPLNPLRVCPVLGPRQNLHAKPFQRFGIALSSLNGEGFRNTVISGFNSTASTLAVYASCRRRRRLRNTRFRLAATLGRFTLSDDRVHSVNFVVFSAEGGSASGMTTPPSTTDFSRRDKG